MRKAQQDAAVAKSKMERLRKRPRRRRRSGAGTSAAEQGASGGAQPKLHQKSSKDVLAERIEQWRVKEEEFVEAADKLKTELDGTKAREAGLRESSGRQRSA